jgi:hypothetical protein
MTLPGLEIVCAAIVALYLVIRSRLDPAPARFLQRLGFIAAAGALGENTCIILYGFYAYDPAWSVFIGHVPLMVILIWPVVIHSAWDLARHLGATGAVGLPLAVGLLVLADAAFIEPISVHAGLWWWTRPGFFGVPPIGVLGWAVFAAFCAACLRAAGRRDGSIRIEASLVIVAPLLTHLVLIALWWGALRWVSVPIPGTAAVLTAWGVSVIATAWALKRGARRRLPFVEMGLRIPAALFFVALLATHLEGAGALLLFALAFVPPYVALTPAPSMAGPPAGAAPRTAPE